MYIQTPKGAVSKDFLNANYAENANERKSLKMKIESGLLFQIFILISYFSIV